MTQDRIDTPDNAEENEANEREKSPAYHKAYLIDSENISDEWVELLDTMENQDAIFVFYTAKSTHINCERVYKLMERGIGRVQWVKCFEGNNALDFQLVTELGAMIGKKAAAEYIIVSKDNGYNFVVQYWSQRGIAISRTTPSANKKAETLIKAVSTEMGEKSEPEGSEKTAIERLGAVARDSGKTAPSDKFFHEMLKSVDIMDNSLLYGALTAFEGMAAGAEDYRQLRDLDEEKKTALRELLLEDKYERGINYVRLLLYRNGQATDAAEGLYQSILSGPKKNKNKYQKALVEKYGKERGENYYLMTKAHYNHVKKL